MPKRIETSRWDELSHNVIKELTERVKRKYNPTLFYSPTMARNNYITSEISDFGFETETRSIDLLNSLKSENINAYRTEMTPELFERILLEIDQFNEQTGKPTDFFVYDKDYGDARSTIPKSMIEDLKKRGKITCGMIISTGHDKPYVKDMLPYEYYFRYHDEEPDSSVKFAVDICQIVLGRENFKRNQCYIIIGDSGSGKSTLIEHLLPMMNNMFQATKITTRPQRIGLNKDGSVTVTPEEFKRMENKGELVGINIVGKHAYGYSREEIDAMKDGGKDVVLDTSSVLTAEKLKTAYPKYVQIISLEHSSATIDQLIGRYNRMPTPNMNVYDTIKREEEDRIRRILKKERTKDYASQIADYTLPASAFDIKLGALRNHILKVRGVLQ